MAINQHGGKGEYTCVVDRFEASDLGAPFKVLLNKAVRCSFDEAGNMISYCIPDLEGLVRVVAIKRVLHEKKLGGADIKFLRKAIGVKQKEMAARIEMTHEHLPRCESGALVLSPSAEKLLRIYALKSAIKLHKVKSCKAKTDLEEALDRLFDIIKPVAVHAADDVLSFDFWLCEADPSGEWDVGEKQAA
jgi:DNA-binding transcriptional regulator YiaG